MTTALSSFVVAKFGGTSVADYDAMHRSADVVLSDSAVRLVVLSASAGVTNLLVALSEGLEATERFVKLDALRKIQFDILERMQNPLVIREEVERLLENITTLSEAASLATSPALTDELVSHGELMSTLLFVEILRERRVEAQWFDVRKVMRTNHQFGRAEPDVPALAELATQQLAPRLAESLVVTQGFIGRARPCTPVWSTSGPTFPASTPPIRASCPPPAASMLSRSPRRPRWRPLVQKSCIRPRCCPPCAAISRCSSAPAKSRKRAARWCAIKPNSRRCSAPWPCAASRR